MTARVSVDTAGCIGCGACVEACPTDVFRLQTDGAPPGVAVAVYPDDCCACLLCTEDCPVDAIWLDLHLTNGSFISVYDEIDEINRIEPGRSGSSHLRITSARSDGP